MNLDRTFCASPQCEGKCGRQVTEEVKQAMEDNLKPYFSFAYFCGEPEEKDKQND